MSVYTGKNMGFAQSVYNDQQGTALDGDLAFASDVNLVDACTVAMPTAQQNNLLQAGRAVIGSYSDGGSRPGMTSISVSPVNEDVTADDIYGMTVRNQQMQTDADGKNGWGHGRVCNVLRKDRIGGRAWPVAWNAAQPDTLAYVIIKDSVGHGLPIGGFCGSPIAGEDDVPDTIQTTNFMWRTPAAAGQPGQIEILSS